MAAAPEAASQQPAAPVGEGNKHALLKPVPVTDRLQPRHKSPDQQPKLKGSSVLAPGEDASAVLNEIAKRKDVLELEIASIKQELENVNGHIHSLDEASAGGAAGSGSNGNGNGVLKKSGLLSSDSGTPRYQKKKKTRCPNLQILTTLHKQVRNARENDRPGAGREEEEQHPRSQKVQHFATKGVARSVFWHCSLLTPSCCRASSFWWRRDCWRIRSRPSLRF